MTYQEMQERLTKVETLIQAVQQPRYQNKVQNVQETLTQLNTIKENLENKMKILAEAEGTITTGDEAQAVKLAKKGHNVNLKEEMDGGQLFDYFAKQRYDVKERRPDGYPPKEGVEGYQVSRGEGRYPQIVIFQYNTNNDQFTISRMSGYKIDEKEAIKAGMREKSSSGGAGIDSYMTDGNYTPVEISAEGLKDIVDHVMSGLDREGEAQGDFYRNRLDVDESINEAPEGKYYIKIPKDAASQNKAQVIFEDFYGIEYEINESPDGVFMYFKKEDYNAGVIEDLEEDGVEILDNNIPGVNEEKIEVDGDTEFTLKLNHLLDKHVKEIIDEMSEEEDVEDGEDTDYAKRRKEQDDYYEDPDYYKEGILERKISFEKALDYRRLIPRLEALIEAYRLNPELAAQHGFDFKAEEARLAKMKEELEYYDLNEEEEEDFDADDAQKRDEVDIPMSRDDDGIPLGEGDKNHDDGDLDIGHQDDEPHMLKKDVYDIAVYAAKLYKQLKKYDAMENEVDFPHWWQRKVTLAREYMSKAQHYLEFEEKEPMIDQLALEGKYKSDAQRKAIYAAKAEKGELEEDTEEPTTKDIKKGEKDSIVKQAKEEQRKAAIRDFVKRMKKANILDPDGRPLKRKEYDKKWQEFIKDLEKKNLKEARPSGFGTGQGRSKTIKKGRESNQDIKDRLDQPEEELPRIKVINGVPNILKHGKYVPMKKKVNETKISKKKFKELLAEAYYEVLTEAEAPESVQVFTRRYPDLEKALIKLHTDDYFDFVKEVRLITPKPTELAVVIKNNQEYTLKWLGKDWEISVRGERHYLGNATEVQEALKDIAILAKEAPMGEPEDEQEDTGGDAGFDDLGAGGGADTGGLGTTGGEEEGGADLSDEEIDFEDEA